MRTSIIMLMFNGWSMVHSRLTELAKYMPHEDVELLLVDNGSTENFSAQLTWWQQYFPKTMRYIRLDKNYGYGIGNNLGVQEARGEYFIFLNTDVVIHRPFVDEIIPMLIRDHQIILGGKLVNWDGGWNSFLIGGHKYTIPYCEGWALAMSEWAWLELGGFDERYYPYDCEDLDLSITALEKGFHLSSIPEGLFTHLGGKSFEANFIRPDERRKTTEINREKLLQKWQDKFPVISERIGT